SGDGRYLVCASTREDIRVRVWEVESGKEIQQLKGLNVRAHAFAFLPNSRRLLLCGDLGPLGLWDVLNGKEIRRFEEGHRGGLSFCPQGVSPDGHRLLTYGLDRTMRLWDVDTGKQLHCFTGHTAALTGAVFLPDGKFALSSSIDHTMRLWRLP